MKKLTALSLALVLVLLAACSMPGNSTPTPAPAPSASQPASAVASDAADSTAAGEPFHLGYAAPGLGSEYQMMVHDQMVAQCEERGIKLDVLSCEGDVAVQTSQVENFITMGVDGIVIYPADQAAVVDVLKRARGDGIKVVVCDAMDMDVDAYDVLLSASAFDMGDVACKMAAEWIDETFPDAEPGTVKVAVFGFWLTEYFGIRCDVLMDIASYNDKAVVVESYNPGMDNYTTMIPESANILVQQHPDIACMLSFTDSFAIMVDEVLLQKDLDFSKIAQFTVDRTNECLMRIQSSANNESTIRGTAVPGLDVVNDLINSVLGEYDSDLDENKVYAVETLPVTVDNVGGLLDA